MHDDNFTLFDEVDKLVKIYSYDDKYINKVGQIFTSKKSREIYKILTKKELNAKEIARLVCKGDTSKLSNLLFILNKMVDADLVTKQKRRQSKSGHSLTFYKAVPIILVVPPECLEKIMKSKTLKDALQSIFST